MNSGWTDTSNESSVSFSLSCSLGLFFLSLCFVLLFSSFCLSFVLLVSFLSHSFVLLFSCSLLSVSLLFSHISLLFSSLLFFFVLSKDTTWWLATTRRSLTVGCTNTVLVIELPSMFGIETSLYPYLLLVERRPAHF